MKLLFLGIDALDSALLDQFAANMPNVSALRARSASLPLKTTFPPDSDTAWATITTGMNPAEHGIVRFIDPLEKSYQILNVGSKNEVLRGKTFWELAGQAGYKSYAIFPHMCYPVWEMPAVMVARGSSVEDVQATDPEVLRHYPDPASLVGARGFPERSVAAMQEYARRLAAQARADGEFALRLMRANEWDLFFVYWSTIDATGHFFWNYFDPTDPNFEQGHPLQDVIPEAYRLYDEIIGQFLAEVDEETTVILMSDHGHGERPFKLVNVNEVLRAGGLLTSRSLKTNPHINLLEKTKRLAVRTISRYGLARMAGKLMRRFPKAMQSFTRPASINWERTVAYATDMSGVKSYSYGGIMINRAALEGRDYEDVRSQIMGLIREKCVLPDGTSLLRFIARREALYEGPFISSYPDIILEFSYGYGLGWAVDVPLITHADSYNLVPGSHRGETGTFIMRSPRMPTCDSVDVHDVTPTILDLLGLPSNPKLDGKSILNARAE